MLQRIEKIHFYQLILRQNIDSKVFQRKIINFCSSFVPGFPIQKLQSRVLHLHVFDYDRFSRDDSIGEMFLPLCQVLYRSHSLSLLSWSIQVKYRYHLLRLYRKKRNNIVTSSECPCFILFFLF